MKSNNKKGDEFYIKISDPIDMRRNLLESSRSVLKCMQSYERLIDVRDKKLKATIILRSIMKETNLLSSKLKKLLPVCNTKRFKQKSIEKEEDEGEPIIEEEMPIQELPDETQSPSGDELEKIEAELAKIEGSLSKLDK